MGGPTPTVQHRVKDSVRWPFGKSPCAWWFVVGYWSPRWRDHDLPHTKGRRKVLRRCFQNSNWERKKDPQENVVRIRIVFALNNALILYSFTLTKGCSNRIDRIWCHNYRSRVSLAYKRATEILNRHQAIIKRIYMRKVELILYHRREKTLLMQFEEA